jgi:hypothetical protein
MCNETASLISVISRNVEPDHSPQRAGSTGASDRTGPPASPWNNLSPGICTAATTDPFIVPLTVPFLRAHGRPRSINVFKPFDSAAYSPATCAVCAPRAEHLASLSAAHDLGSFLVSLGALRSCITRHPELCYAMHGCHAIACSASQSTTTLNT